VRVLLVKTALYGDLSRLTVALGVDDPYCCLLLCGASMIPEERLAELQGSELS
jgi:hypothetical protein